MICESDDATTGLEWDLYGTRDHRNCRGCGVDGIYRCEIPDSMNVTQSIYIGVYTARSHE